MNFNVIRERIRPEEALIIFFFFALVALRFIAGVGWMSVGPLTERVMLLSLPLLAFIFYVLWIIPFAIAWIKNLRKGVKGSTRVSYDDAYKLLLKGLADMVSFARGYIPFIMIVAIYDSFTERFVDGCNLTRVIFKNDLTYLLIKADQTLLGTQASYLLQNYITPRVNDLMYFGYALHFFFPFALATYFYVLAKKTFFRELILGVVIVSCIGYVGYLTFPSMSPLYVLPYEKDLDGGPISETVAAEIAKVRSAQNDCCLFPSLHVGISCITLMTAFRRDKKAFWILLPFVVLSWISTIYLRRHFAIDVIAGWVIAAVGAHLTPKIDEWWYNNLNKHSYC